MPLPSEFRRVFCACAPTVPSVRGVSPGLPPAKMLLRYLRSESQHRSLHEPLILHLNDNGFDHIRGGGSNRLSTSIEIADEKCEGTRIVYNQTRCNLDFAAFLIVFGGPAALFAPA